MQIRKNVIPLSTFVLDKGPTIKIEEVCCEYITCSLLINNTLCTESIKIKIGDTAKMKFCAASYTEKCVTITYLEMISQLANISISLH